VPHPNGSHPSTPNFSKWKKLTDAQCRATELRKAKNPHTPAFVRAAISVALKENLPVLAQNMAQVHSLKGECARIAKLRAEAFLRENPNSRILGRDESKYDDSHLDCETQGFAQQALYTPCIWINGVSDILPSRTLLKIARELAVEFMFEAERQNKLVFFKTALHISNAYALTELAQKIELLDLRMWARKEYANGNMPPEHISPTFAGVCAMGRKHLRKLPLSERYAIYGRVAHELGQLTRALKYFRKAEQSLQARSNCNMEDRREDLALQIAQIEEEIKRKTN